MPPVALSIAGSDPSGGAGIQADLKTFHQFGVYGEAVITLITAQNSRGVQRVQCLSPDLVEAQLRTVLEDIPPDAAKTGALGHTGIIQIITRARFDFPLVVDPVMFAKGGEVLTGDDLRPLVPRAFLITPNLAEAEALTGLSDMRKAAQELCKMGARAALVKGGHLEGAPIDILYSESEWHEFSGPRIQTRHTHGTGCTFSAAIVAQLACGISLVESVRRAKLYITEAIRTNPGLGGGAGPVNHHATLSI